MMCKVGFLLFLPKNLFSLHHLYNFLPQCQLNHGNGFAGEVVAKTFLFAFRVQRPKHPQSFLVGFLELAWFELAS